MSSDNKKFEIERRQFFKKLMVGAGVLASNPLEIFITNTMVHYLQRANALAAGDLDPNEMDFKYIHLLMAGGVPRYYWDLPLAPNGNDLMEPNGMIISKFLMGDSGIAGGEYATTKVGDFHMPHIWSSNIPTSLGGVVPMADLAQNMLIIRGINLLLDDHHTDRIRQVAPVPGGVSLTGLVADRAKTPMPAIDFSTPPSQFFKSELGLFPVLIPDGNQALKSMLDPFIKPQDALLSMNNGQVENAIDRALAQMQTLASGKGKYVPSTYTTRANAKKMMLRDFGDLVATYNAISTKYKTLMQKALRASEDNLKLEGIDDQILPGGTTNKFRVEDGMIFNGTDLRTIINDSTVINNMVHSFTVTEYMITKGLTSSVNAAIGSMSGVTFSSLTNGQKNQTGKSINSDAHFVGAYAGLFAFSRYYRAVSACMYELISTLKATPAPGGSLFDRSVIALTSDFNRSAKFDGSGADHGWRGSSYTIFSGMIDKLIVMGNVQTSEENRYAGTWGVAGPVDELGKRETMIGNAASTVAAMLEMDSPTPNDISFITKKDGKVIPVVKSAKNIKPDKAA